MPNAIVDGQQRCTACEETKPLSAFKPKADAPEGYESRCRVCRKARIKTMQERKAVVQASHPDPDDRRFWPIAIGGTTVFGGADATNHPRRYSAIAPAEVRSTMPVPTVEEIKNRSTPAAIKARARIVMDMALDRVEALLPAAKKLSDVATTISALGKISGVASVEIDAGENLTALSREARLERLAGLLAFQPQLGAGGAAGEVIADAVVEEVVGAVVDDEPVDEP